MAHHTVDPTHPESFPLVRSLIDQYAPNFTSPFFNICCDETFDLKKFEAEGLDVGRLYVDFVKKIIAHVNAKGKQVMMWGDILLQHPEVIDELPEDTVFLNWDYAAQPGEASVERFARLGRPQIVCPGTGSWSRFCENTAVEESNISLMAHYGKQYGALGLLNTNWGDWGNPCSLEMSAYGLALGAAKSWSEATALDEAWEAGIDRLLYGTSGTLALLRRISRLHERLPWQTFCRNALASLSGDALTPLFPSEEFPAILAEYRTLRSCLESLAPSLPEDFAGEFSLCLDALCRIAEASLCQTDPQYRPVLDPDLFAGRFTAHWLAANKESERRYVLAALMDHMDSVN